MCDTTDTVSKFLGEHFGIDHIPCYGWLTTLLPLIKPDSLNRCMMKFVIVTAYTSEIC